MAPTPKKSIRFTQKVSKRGGGKKKVTRRIGHITNAEYADVYREMARRGIAAPQSGKIESTTPTRIGGKGRVTTGMYTRRLLKKPLMEAVRAQFGFGKKNMREIENFLLYRPRKFGETKYRTRDLEHAAMNLVRNIGFERAEKLATFLFNFSKNTRHDFMNLKAGKETVKTDAFANAVHDLANLGFQLRAIVKKPKGVLEIMEENVDARAKAASAISGKDPRAARIRRSLLEGNQRAQSDMEKYRAFLKKKDLR